MSLALAHRDRPSGVNRNKRMKTLRSEQCREALIARINRLSPESKPRWGKMNVEQMLSHLVQGDELPFVASVPDRSSLMSRTILKPLMLYVLPMPKEIPTSPAMDQQQNGRKPAGFDSDKRQLIDSMHKLGTLDLNHKCLDHPFFGSLSPRQWAALAHKHIDHHLRQFGV